ncbi:uncharacterized protein PRCAT00001048001 [Priceomyces carsonii]|uniref:uncharacterized protein n=1 Tax=Priceomyces carsonii TaxID=28549 RepID=UPI002ED908F9|nr:unnamed protein product [Priceomyces carsonii]
MYQYYDKKKNPLHEIALVSFTLGAVIGCCIILVVSETCTEHSQLLIYCTIICIYYLNEFLTTSLFQPSRTSSKLFLIYGNKGNKEFFMVQLITVWEFLLKRSIFFSGFITYSRSWYLICSGFLLIVIGFFMRTLAMATCGESFSHIIITEKENRTKLITTGIYGWFRHPSYLGFWLFSIGCQLFLENSLSLVVTIISLGYFFKVRIEFEEWFLINRMFGDEYLEYKLRVGVWIPFVVLKER